MGQSYIQLRMSVALLWLLFILCDTTATGEKSRDQLDQATCSTSGNGENHENRYQLVDDQDPKSHNCGINRKENKVSDIPIFRGEYTFPVDPVPRRNCFDEEAMEFLQNGLPIVLENCTFHKPAMKWSIKYLTENLNDQDHTAYLSKNRKFLYYDGDRMKGAYKEWNPPTKRMLMYFKNFSELIKELEEADNGSRAYFQSLLYLQDGVSASMLKDIDSFNYTWLLDLVRRVNWGEDVTNMLLVGMPDVVTPAHFDILENLYVQIFGRKRVILFSPDSFRFLYPYPIGHPHDRQTQVDFDEPDLNKFPRFGEIRGMDVALEPDEVLYIPNYWWHYIESESRSKTISMNFWFDPMNGTKNHTHEDSEISDSTSLQPEKEKEREVENLEAAETAGPDNSDGPAEDRLQSLNNDHLKHDVEDNNKTEGDETGKEGSGEEAKKAPEEKDVTEEDEKEIELSAAQYLALMRETEMSLFKATLSHEKVKQILEELLSRRFDYL